MNRVIEKSKILMSLLLTGVFLLIPGISQSCTACSESEDLQLGGEQCHSVNLPIIALDTTCCSSPRFDAVCCDEDQLCEIADCDCYSESSSDRIISRKYESIEELSLASTIRFSQLIPALPFLKFNHLSLSSPVITGNLCQAILCVWRN